MIFGFSRMRAVVDALQRHAGARPRGRSIAAATASCSAKAPGWWCSSARTGPARAARRIYATDRRLRLDLRRVSPRADGSRRRADRARDALAIERSGRAVEEIGYVNYHGTSTRAERRGRVALRAAAVRRARRPRAGVVHQVDDRPPAGRQRRRRASSPRRSRCRAGSCRRRSTSTSAIPACDLDFIPNTGRAAQPAAALCNCLGFGSKNSAIVLGAGGP